MIKARYKVVPRGSSFQATVTSTALPKGRERRTFATEADGHAWGEKAVNRLKSGLPIDDVPKVARRRPNNDKPWTLQELLEYVKREHWQKKTVTSGTIIQQAQSIVSTIGRDTPIVDVDFFTITTALQRLEDGKGVPAFPNSGGSCNRKWAYLRVMLKYAVRLELIHRIPEIEKRPEGAAREFRITPELERLMLAWADQMGLTEFRDFMIFGIYVGARENELLKLTLSKRSAHTGHVEENHIIFPHPNPIIKNKGLRRDIKMAPWVKRVIMESRAEGREKVFPTLDKGMINRTWNRMKSNPEIAAEIAKQHCPEDFVPHIMRHEFCSRLGDLGSEAFDLMRLSGHKTVSAVQRYVKIKRERTDLIMERLFAATPQSPKLTVVAA